MARLGRRQSFKPIFRRQPPPASADYTRDAPSSLPITREDLATRYSAQDYIDVATDDGTRVAVTGISAFVIHQFKNYVGSNTTATFHWNGQSTLAPSTSPVFLQAYNLSTLVWDTLVSNSSASASTDFDLTSGSISITNYKDGSGITSCRVYQVGV